MRYTLEIKDILRCAKLCGIGEARPILVDSLHTRKTLLQWPL
jgi:hypothetical protein